MTQVERRPGETMESQGQPAASQSLDGELSDTQLETVSGGAKKAAPAAAPAAPAPMM